MTTVAVFGVVGSTQHFFVGNETVEEGNGDHGEDGHEHGPGEFGQEEYGEDGYDGAGNVSVSHEGSVDDDVGDRGRDGSDREDADEDDDLANGSERAHPRRVP